MKNASPEKKTVAEKKLARKKRRRIIWISVLVILVAFRLYLPHLVLKYVNKQLSQMKSYYGHVEDIDLHLYRGAYVIKDIRIMKIETNYEKHDTIPFFSAVKIDLSVEWKALFKGRVVGEIYLESPVINLVKGRHKDEDLKADTADFNELVNDLMPLTVNHFEISNGEVHFIDPYSKPKLDLFVDRIYVFASNLSNVNKEKVQLPATLTGTGNVYGGNIDLDVKFDALANQPTFDLNAEMQKLNLVHLNPMLTAYANVDVKKGEFNMFTEFAGKEGKFKGYVKPVIKDLDVVQWNKEEGNLKQILWETLVGTGVAILTNPSKDQFATKVEVEGSFENPNVNSWRAISFVLRNAFVRALRPSIDHVVTINYQKEEKNTFLEKVFGKKKKKGEKEKEEKRKKD